MLLLNWKNNRAMKKYFFITIFLILESCLSFRSCDWNKLAGRYYCYNNNEAINWLDIKKDGTFQHYYKEGDIKLSHSGTWKKSEKGNCAIEIGDWKTFNEKGKDYELLGSMYLWITDNYYLDIGPDGESSTSFEKSKEDMSVNPLENTPK